MNQAPTGIGRRRRPAVVTRWPVRRWMTLLAVVEVTLLVAAITGGAIALDHLGRSRIGVIERIDPQLVAANELTSALLDQETGVRGYVLTGRQDFLEPYEQGRAGQDKAVAELRRLGAGPGTDEGRDLDEVLNRAAAWQSVTRGWPTAVRGAVGAREMDDAKTTFDAVRAALGVQREHLEQARVTGKAVLNQAGTFLSAMLVLIAVLLVLLFLVLYLGFRRRIAQPLQDLAAEVRAVADVDMRRRIEGGGPHELVELAADIEAMRQRIVDEVSELHEAHALLDKRTQELQRSNSDLEQFAYVASHDLQEPLRKVASFCQLLERRYSGQLDERGEQYIAFAVDGAKRMQVLINDLLAFSRVGRRGGEHVVVDTGELLDTALANLAAAIEESGAVITRTELPRVRGEASLLTAVFQNLINNAVKFHGEGTPEIGVEAHRDGAEWVFSVSDNGIGIDAEYAERIFVIFQRLHGKDSYPGTGIGLAMCRRIIEYHGGRVWLDTSTGDEKTRFCFTLPALDENEES